MRDDRTILLFLWVLAYLVGLSVPGAKNIRYLLPIFPATAILAKTVQLEQGEQTNGRKKKRLDGQSV